MANQDSILFPYHDSQTGRFVAGFISPHRDDITGKRFGALVVQDIAWIDGIARVHALCDCGALWEGRANKLKTGQRSCRLCAHKRLGNNKRKDITGQRFGQLVVQAIYWIEGKAYAQAICDCGGTWEGLASQLKSNHTTSCRCKKRTHSVDRRTNLKGERFGKLVVRETIWVLAGLGTNAKNERRVIADCDCGNVWQGRSSSLTRETITSCGCEPQPPTKLEELWRGRLMQAKRRSRKKELPDQFDHTNLEFMLHYWQWTCAICSREEGGLWHTLALDHFIPLMKSDCPGTVPWNVLPLCHATKDALRCPGQRACNNSKGKKDPQAWLEVFFREQYGPKLAPRKAKAKLREIDRYFAAARAFEEQRQQTLAVSAYGGSYEAVAL